MRLFYSFGIFLFELAIRFIAKFNTKAKFWVEGRSDWKSILKKNIPDNKKVIWFHCASLGEFEQGRSVIEAYKKVNPDHFILLTFFSPSGYEVRKKYSGADFISYLPSDKLNNSKAFLSMVKPYKAYFVKYEFWFNYLNQLKNHSIDTYLISGIFREKQHFFKWYGSWFKKQLSAFTHFYLQNQQSGELLKSIGYNNYSVCGDTRFDRVNELVRNTTPVKAIEDFSANNYTIIAGSTWPKDEELLAQLIKSNKNIKLVIAPHEIHDNHLKQLSKLFGQKAGFFTQGEFDRQVLIVDTIGILSSIYRYGKWAYIGGGFGGGIHNTLEAVSYGIPVIFGPNYQKFQEAKDLISLKAGASIHDEQSFLAIAEKWIKNEEVVKEMGLSAKKYVLSQLGATNLIVSETTDTKKASY